MGFVFVRHNIEVAHRLLNLPGKCEQIHGHSMNVELMIHGHVDNNGLLDGRDFGNIKKVFREYLDSTFDHHLLLNEQDPWAGLLAAKSVLEKHGPQPNDDFAWDDYPDLFEPLPGLVKTPGDPTTENIAKWIAEWAANTFSCKVNVIIQETGTNGAGYAAHPSNDTIWPIAVKDKETIGED